MDIIVPDMEAECHPHLHVRHPQADVQDSAPAHATKALPDIIGPAAPRAITDARAPQQPLVRHLEAIAPAPTLARQYLTADAQAAITTVHHPLAAADHQAVHLAEVGHPALQVRDARAVVAAAVINIRYAPYIFPNHH